MKPIIIAILAAFALVGCNQEKATIESDKETTQNAIDNRKDEVGVAAAAAKQ